MAKKSQPLERISGSLFDSLEKSETFFNEGNYAQEPAIENKRLSVWAILSAVFGALGFFALVNLGFLVFAVFGFFASIVALITISRMGGELQGKKIAALGLTLSLAASISGPLRSYVYERAFDKQADLFVKAWFEAVKNEDWAVAHQMTQPYWGRSVFATHQDEIRYWRGLLNNEEEVHSTAHSYLCNPTILTIKELGDRIKPSYYATTATNLTASDESTIRVYAFTIEPETPDGKKQTFFLSFVLERVMRKTPQGETLVGWQMRSNDFIPLKLDAQGRPIDPKA